MTRYFAPLFAVLGAIGFAFTFWLIFTDTPLQYSWQPSDRHLVLATGSGSLFFNQKIFFWHVPHAIVLLSFSTKYFALNLYFFRFSASS